MPQPLRLLLVTAAVTALLHATPAVAEFIVSVETVGAESWRSADEKASHASEVQCAQSLVDTLPASPIEGLRVKNGAVNPQLAIAVATTSTDIENAAIGIAREPYLFHDASHFLAFMRSDVMKRLRQADAASTPAVTWLGIAYGGFYHLFSTSRAITEPKHVFEQEITGAFHAGLYKRFSSGVGSSGAGYVSLEDDDIRMEFESLPGGSKDGEFSRPDAIVATLAQASAAHNLQAARFINLTSSAVYPVLFYIPKRAAERFAAQPPAMREWVERWVEATAFHCSTANFQREREILDSLKKRGHTVVPANREAFVEGAWTWSLHRLAEQPSFASDEVSWTSQDLDAIARLQPGKLPSSLIQKLPRAEQIALAAHNRKIAEERAAEAGAQLQRSKTAASAVPLQRRWQDGVSAIADRLRKDADALACRPGWPVLDARCTNAKGGLVATSTACPRNPIADAEKGRAMADGWYAPWEAVRQRIDAASGKLAGLKDARTFIGVSANTFEDQTPGETLYLLEKIASAAPPLRQELLGAFAALYQTNGKDGVGSGFKTSGQPPWQDWDWLDDFRASALLWIWAGDRAALVQLKADLAKAEALSTATTKAPMTKLGESVRQTRVKALHELLDAGISRLAPGSASADGTCAP